MKNYLWKIQFKTGQWEKVYATGSVTAKILAQAEQIKKGHDHEIDRIWVEIDGEWKNG